MIDTRAIRMRWEADGSKRDERGQRLFAASEARAAGWGGVAAVAKITGVSRKRGLGDRTATASLATNATGIERRCGEVLQAGDEGHQGQRCRDGCPRYPRRHVPS